MDRHNSLLVVYAYRLLRYCTMLGIALSGMFVTLWVARSGMNPGWLVVLGLAAFGAAVLVRLGARDWLRLAREDGKVARMAEETHEQAVLRLLRYRVLRNTTIARIALLIGLVALYVASGGLRLSTSVQIPLAAALLLVSTTALVGAFRSDILRRMVSGRRFD